LFVPNVSILFAKLATIVSIQIVNNAQFVDTLTYMFIVDPKTLMVKYNAYVKNVYNENNNTRLKQREERNLNFL